VGKTTFLKLNSPIQYIKGVGPKRALYFKKIGVEIVSDLLFLVPKRYLDYSNVVKIKDLKIGDEVTVVGRVSQVEVVKTRNRRDLVNVLLTDETGAIVLKWFNRPDLRKKFKSGDRVVASGKVGFFYGQQLVNPMYEIIGEQTSEDYGSIIPIYPLTEGLGLWDVRRAVRISLEECLNEVEETIPSWLIEKNNLMTINDALYLLHFPSQIAAAAAARRRLVYDEFFFFELTLARRKANMNIQEGVSLKENGQLTQKFLALLPFSLTQGQKMVIREIIDDMAKTKPMNRLLQGDVGAGKTAVAIYAMLIAIECGYQAVLMVPTEILAEQHYLVLHKLLERIGLVPYLLTSSMKATEKKKTMLEIRDARAKLVFGTHALIEEKIEFKNLGLVVIDEQHRFGVMQRAALVNKGINPHFLVLSATPIPRTLALTLYGDLDISTLTEKPPGRGEVRTRIIKAREHREVVEFINQEVLQGRQAFIVCPIIEKSSKLDLRSAEEIYQETQVMFPHLSVGLIHGRMKTDERIRVMGDFRGGKIKILVATTVIEVGVDIPNATIMLIEHPERFGLAQLHQLRGRIGRGAQESYCFLLLDRFVSPETYERLSFFAKNNDGFVLAQKDFRLRGPGEILGKRQHGLPDIKIGDIEEDKELLFLARDDSFNLIKKDPELNLPENYMIKRNLMCLGEREKLLRIG